jgi:hypothetical protein
MTTNTQQTPGVKAWLKRRWKYVVGIAGIIGAAAAVIGLIHMWWPANSPPTPNIFGGDCTQVGNNNKCTIQRQADELSRSTTSPQLLKEHIAKFSQAPPKDSGPWPYFVFDTVNIATGQDVGLKVKRAPSVEGEQVGSAPPGSLLWADCYVMNDYDPEVDNSVDVGPKWLRIHWPTDTTATTYNRSSPQSPFLEYVYAGYALPFTHNGNIPRCS